jgi:hypothetical protein
VGGNGACPQPKKNYLIMETKVIYISPNYDNHMELFEEMESMTDAEKIAKVYELKCNEVELLTLDKFQTDFNADMMSDLGFIFFVQDKV